MSDRCECGRTAYVKQTQECMSCYNRRRRAEADWVPSAPFGPACPKRTPCGYRTAHTRVRFYRGLPSRYACVKCGDRAMDWAYRGGSHYEQRSWHLADGTRRHKEATWSSWCMDYEPMCRRCHWNHDRSDARDYVGTTATGVRGVRIRRGKYQVRVRAAGAQHYIGSFPTLDQADDAAEAARKRLLGGP